MKSGLWLPVKGVSAVRVHLAPSDVRMRMAALRSSLLSRGVRTGRLILRRRLVEISPLEVPTACDHVCVCMCACFAVYMPGLRSCTAFNELVRVSETSLSPCNCRTLAVTLSAQKWTNFSKDPTMDEILQACIPVRLIMCL